MSIQLEQETAHTKLTPMMQQWMECKQEAKESLLFFRLGDFYEAFYEDAALISKELELTLTARQDIPMCGIPWHTSEVYIDRLVAKGYKIAIAEQVEDPKKTKGLVKRKIVRVVSPGSTLSSGIISEKTSNFFAAISYANDVFGLAFIDVSSPVIEVFQCRDQKELINELFRNKPKEILISRKFKEKQSAALQDILLNLKTLITVDDDWVFSFDQALDKLLKHFRVLTLDGFGMKGMNASIQAAGALLQYISDSLLMPVDHIRILKPLFSDSYLFLDRATLTNLELVDPIDGSNHSNTLLSHLDETKTPMGARLLRQWIKKPLVSIQEIQLRQDALAECIELETQDPDRMHYFDKNLERIRDLERLLLRIKTFNAGPREYVALCSSCEMIPSLIEVLSNCHSQLIKKLQAHIHDHKELVVLIRSALVDNPPLRMSDGGVFKEGYCQELDELINIRKNSQAWLASYQTKLRDETGIKTLKVGYNKMFGYYIEVSRGQIDKIPDTLQRRQTLVNGERYISKELKEYEEKVLTADARIQEIEQDLFAKLQKDVTVWHESILITAEALAEIDVIRSLSHVALKRKYIRPYVDSTDILHIEGGRHPVIEALATTGKFVPNDIHLEGKDKTLMIITGPNMAGKSTYIRQAALLVIMAQIGSFIPATKAHIGVVDKVFSRIGASDDLARGQSTFMVEMAETASILNQATNRSLVILDEIGRGTSTYDGISIAWSVAEYLVKHEKKRAKTLFATHYYELTDLEQESPHVANYTVAVSETHDGIVFLRKIIKGKTDRSYGIHVAKIAGLPAEVIHRAQELLHTLESKHKSHNVIQKHDISSPSTANSSTIPRDDLFFIQQMPKRSGQEQVILDQVAHANINTMTPLQALNAVAEWQKKLKK